MTKILIYNSKPYNNNFHLILSLVNAFSSVPDVDTRVANSYSLGLFLKNFHPQIVLAFGGEEVPLHLVSQLKQPNTTWILWTTEDPFELKRNQSSSKAFDIILTSDRASQASYHHPHCYHLPLAADPQIFYRPVIENPDKLVYDIAFVGTAWPNRTKFLTQLLQFVRKYGLRSRFIMPANLSIPPATLQALDMHKFERDFRISPKDLASLHNSSGFAITLFRDFSADGKTRYQSSPTNRFFETALSGTGQIIASEDIDIKQFYPEIAHSIFQISNAQEVIEIILENRKNGYQQRNQSVAEVQKFILDKHLYKHRVQEIMKIYQDVKSKNSSS